MGPCRLRPFGRTIGSPAVRPARIDSNSQGEDPSASKRNRAVLRARYAPNSQRRGPKTPCPCCLQHGVRCGRSGRPPVNQRPTGPLLVLELRLLTLPRGLLQPLFCFGPPPPWCCAVSDARCVLAGCEGHAPLSNGPLVADAIIHGSHGMHSTAWQWS